MGAGTVVAGMFLILLILVGGMVLINMMNVDTTGTGKLKQDEFQKLLFDADKLKIKPNANEKICDVKITVYGELHGTTALNLSDNLNPLPANLKILLGKGTAHPEIKKYEWFDCHESTSVPMASLLDFGLDFGDEKINNSGIQPGDFDTMALFPVEEKIHAQIVLKSGPFKVDAITQPGMKKYIFIPAGNVPLPYDMRAVFVVQNIPARDYEMEIYYGIEINNMSPGQPLVDRIGKPNS